jgi:hypothetical protein
MTTTEEPDGSVALEISYVAQMNLSWPDLVALAQQTAEQHGAPPGTTPKVIRVATSRSPGLWLFRWRNN